MILDINYTKVKSEMKLKHEKCTGTYDYFGDFDCGYNTTLDCEQCKYGIGRKDPEAKCNTIKGRANVYK